ncbi:MAG: AAA family ATPase [Mangrovibacterium sp.]
MNQALYITIGRQLGSGGRQIGKKLAKLLNLAFYDKELIEIASRESGLGKEFFEQADEKSSHSLIGGLFGLKGSMVDELYSGHYLSNETLFKIQSDVIRDLASRRSSLFIGRCADYVLKDMPRCLNVFVCANFEDRISRVCELMQLPESKARDFMEKTDKKRAAYYNYYSNKEWGNASSYHLCVNSSVLGIEKTVLLIRDVAEKQFDL